MSSKRYLHKFNCQRPAYQIKDLITEVFQLYPCLPSCQASKTLLLFTYNLPPITYNYLLFLSLVVDCGSLVNLMKKDIHPTYHQAKVRCACGNIFTIGSTKPEISVEICYSCHPFYTGKTKVLDVAGRVEKFKARSTKSAEKPVRKKSEKKAAKKATKASKK